MEQVTINIYTASELKELNNGAFQHAYDWYLSGFDYGWWKEINEVLDAFHEAFNVKLECNFDYPSYSKVDVFTVDYDYRGNLGYTEEVTSEDIRGQKLVNWPLNRHFHDIYQGKYYSTRGYYDENRKYHYRFRHSRVLFEPRCLCGVCFGYTVMDPIHNLIANRRDVSEHYTLTDLYTDCAKALAESVYDDLEYQQSEAAFLESAESNDWKFTEDGDFFS